MAFLRAHAHALSPLPHLVDQNLFLCTKPAWLGGAHGSFIYSRNNAMISLSLSLLLKFSSSLSLSLIKVFEFSLSLSPLFFVLFLLQCNCIFVVV